MQAMRKDTSVKFRTSSPEDQGDFGVARPTKAKHSVAIKHAREVTLRAYRNTLKELAKV